MGRFLAPYGNAIKCGPFQALLATVFSAVMATSLAGGRRDLFQDVLPEKQRLYFVMVDMLEASLLALTYTNDAFTGYVFIEISTIAACALVMAKDNGPNLIATIRYLFMSLVGSGLFLIGLTVLNSITGYLLMPSLAEAVAELRITGDYRIPLTVSVGLIVAGLGVKSAMFPFHLWLPDAHGGATTASSAILSGLVLKGYIVLLMVLILRVFSVELLAELGVTNVIPFFGPFIGAVPATLLILIEDPVKALWFVLFILVLQQLDGNVIGPKILGDTTGLSSFWVLFSILLFGGLWGFWGVFFAIPLATLIKTIISRWPSADADPQRLLLKAKD